MTLRGASSLEESPSYNIAGRHNKEKCGILKILH